MLQTAPLNLDSYFYTNIHASLDMSLYFDGSAAGLSREDLTFDFVVHEDLDSSDNLIITLILKTESDSKKPLKIEIEVLGRFVASSELLEKIRKEECKQEQVISNSLAILYSSIRDQVLSLTAKMPIGPTFLPTCIFNIERIHPKQENTETKTKERKTRSTTNSKKNTNT